MGGRVGHGSGYQSLQPLENLPIIRKIGTFKQDGVTRYDHGDVLRYTTSLLNKQYCTPGDVLRLLNNLQQANIPLDTITCNAALTVCANGIKNTSSENVGMIWGRFQNLLEAMQQANILLNTTTCNAALTVCANAIKNASAENAGIIWGRFQILLEVMQQTNIPLGTISYTAALTVCANAIKNASVEDGGMIWGRFQNLLGAMQQANIPLDTITYTAALTVCANAIKNASVEDAGMIWDRFQNLLGAMQQANIPLDTIAYTAALTVCANAIRNASAEDAGMIWERFQNLLEAMQQASILLDKTTCNAAFKVCANGMNLATKRRINVDMIDMMEFELKVILEQMNARRVCVSPHTYNLVIEVCVSLNKCDYFAQIVQSMLIHRVPILRSLVNQPDVKHLFTDIHYPVIETADDFTDEMNLPPIAIPLSEVSAPTKKPLSLLARAFLEGPVTRKPSDRETKPSENQALHEPLSFSSWTDSM